MSEMNEELNEVWKPISLTLVEYREGDRLGRLLAWISLTPIFLVVSFVTLIVMRRDLHTMVYFGGQLGNEILNYIIKHIVKHPRPVRRRDKVMFVEYGMPSSHAQFMTFFTVYLTLFLFYRLHRNQNSVHNLWKFFVFFFSSVTAILVCYSRIYLLYHTTTQVLLGAMLGAFVAVVWFLVVQNILTPLFPYITQWRVSEFLMIRDSTHIPNSQWFEYYSNRVETRNRLRKIQ